MSEKLFRNAFLLVLGFLAIGAMGGGLVFIISPSGDLMGMPVSELRNSPFDSFLIPGIILFCVLGLLPLFLIYALIKKPRSGFAERLNLLSDMHWSWTFSIYVAFALIGWIQIQMVILQTVHWLHTFYMFYSIFIMLFALLPQIRASYKK